MTNLSLFDDVVVDAPPTEGIKYAGSKLKLSTQFRTRVSAGISPDSL